MKSLCIILVSKVLQDVNRQLACDTKEHGNVYFVNATDGFVYNGTSKLLVHGREVYVNETIKPDLLHASGYGAMKG